MINVWRNERRRLRADLVRDPVDGNPCAPLVDEQDLLIGMAMRRHVPAGRQGLGPHRERPRSCRPGFHEDLDRAPMFVTSEPENLAVTAPPDMVHRSLLPVLVSCRPVA